ncbi:MAG: DNA-3-methyladenine glycosylase [Balneolaceae bacterium]|nr:DNA-3-methyladenine glycosylase [Balneolaceae bacterium]
MSLVLPYSFYRRNDVVAISRELLGKVLCTEINGSEVTAGIITETEAYRGRDDKACHAHGKRTARTEVMYHDGGKAYVYLCYGIHHLFNIVTNTEGVADAILVRAIKPLEGINLMLERRGQEEVAPKLTAGPGRVSQALGITKEYYGKDLTDKSSIWIEDREVAIDPDEIASSPRIGVEYAGEDAKRPWRFFLKESKWVS